MASIAQSPTVVHNVSEDDNFTFTVGKLDAGMAILIGEKASLIEFPSLLLPAGVSSGSVVNIRVHRNYAEESKHMKEFWDLQDTIYNEYGTRSPSPPNLKLRNVTQTSVTLEWDPIELATASLLGLDIYRNGQRLAAIPNPMHNTSTKLSGLDVDHEYSFHLVLKTTSGTYSSNVIRTRTHTINDTSGIIVCFGTIQDPELDEAAKEALETMGAKWSDKIQIDTTHFVCTTPAADTDGRGAPTSQYQKAMQMSIPVVQPHWLLACSTEKKMVPISAYYLGSVPPNAAAASTVSLARRNTNVQPPSGSGAGPSMPQSAPATSADATQAIAQAQVIGSTEEQQRRQSADAVTPPPPPPRHDEERQEVPSEVATREAETREHVVEPSAGEGHPEGSEPSAAESATPSKDAEGQEGAEVAAEPSKETDATPVATATTVGKDERGEEGDGDGSMTDIAL